MTTLPTAGDAPAAGPTRPDYAKKAQFIRKEGGRSRKVGGHLGAKLGLVICFWSAIHSRAPTAWAALIVTLQCRLAGFGCDALKQG
jgi:hypothetical protein